jgi:hypothetical protein
LSPIRGKLDSIFRLTVRGTINDVIDGAEDMDRDEALKLLGGGRTGIQEWNRRRESGEYIPNLSDAKLSGANLGGANLSGANLGGANLCAAELDEANLRWANLIEANLIEANLSKANLSKANLSGAHLRAANLSEANLSEADLKGATMLSVDLRGTKLSDCQIFGISVWDAKTDDRTEQKNLIVSWPTDPVLTVDNLEVAQFIYLLLNNTKIRDVIDTITSKVVLILGRFTSERKAVLDALRGELRLRNYLPVMFDFEKPRSKSYTATITTLTRMARFIIADLTDATEVRAELIKIVPDLPSVPVQPLLLASTTAFVTSEDYKNYHWVLEPFRYRDLDDAIASMPNMVLNPVEAKLRELRS